MLMTSVMTNRVRPTAKRVLYCSDPCTLSPSAAEAMNPVIVCPPSSGLVTILAWLPAAMATIIVSPTARLRPRTIAAAMPEMAAGKTTRSTVRIRLAPRP